MLNKLRIGPKLLLAPGLVLVLLTLLSGGRLLRHGAPERLARTHGAGARRAPAGGGRRRRRRASFAHANIYQLLAWINGSFAQNRLDAPDRRHRPQARGHRRPAWASWRKWPSRPNARWSTASQAALARLPQGRGRNDRDGAGGPVDRHQLDAEGREGVRRARRRSWPQLAALEKSLSEEAYAAARAEFRTLGVTMAGLVLLSIALSLPVTMLVRRAMLADIRVDRARWWANWPRAAWRGATGTPRAATKSPTPRARSTTPSARLNADPAQR